MWQAKLEINTDNLKYNISQIKKYVGKNVEIMPVIKSDGYKTYLNKHIEILENEGINIVGVAITDEAVFLRKQGYKKDIFILNQPYEEDLKTIADNNIITGVGSIEFLREMTNFNANFKIHVEIGTGMGRTGIHPYKTKEFFEEAKKYKNIEIEGIYTHFSSADSDFEYTASQIKSFNYAIKVAQSIHGKFKYIHAAASAGIINFKEAHYNLVRPGLIMYGYYPNEYLKEKIDLKPVIKLKTKVSFIKEVEKNTSISYGRTFITERKSKIATVQLGYADGIRRCLANKGYVVINNKLAKIVGNVCMDSFMIDITDIKDVDVGDDVYIWDNENITIEDIANIYNTINYEVISTISNRVEREYI